ncbi:hypothetical protein OC842_006292 [Tilletia horrida]|uniref:Uncharacterized protein n=1 Tax=Tilletia horrida TaxID=155126 RepID=A0AAN6G8H8_9BASI|nr:hypothetical protein OC842_006292 [Tilletia horrida]
MNWANLLAVLGLAMTASMAEARPSTSTSCYTVRVSGTRTITSSLAPQTRRPTVTSTPVSKSTVTVTRLRTSTAVVSTVSTVRVTSSFTALTQTITPTQFTVTVPTVTTVAPGFTPTQTDVLITPSPGTFTSTSTTFTAPAGPTLPVALPRRAALEPAAGEEGEVIEEREGSCKRGEEETAFRPSMKLNRRAAGESVKPGDAKAAARKLRGRRIYCRRIVRLDAVTVRATRTRTVTVKTTVRPRTTTTSTVTAVSTSTFFNTVGGVLVTAAPTTSTITAPAITSTSTPTAATVTTTVTILTPQPTLVVPRQRSLFCGPLARPFNSDLIGVSDATTQELDFVDVPAGEDCCDVGSNIPGAVAYADFGGQCIVNRIQPALAGGLCVAGNPATSALLNLACGPTCPAGGFLQCGAGA